MSLSYKDAGVDLDSYAVAMQRLPALIQRTQTPRVLPLMGGFAGLFQLQGDGRTYRDPVLVSGSDGVGTKIKVATLARQHDTIGIDLVAMCVNDCLCLGAEPLFFLDYIALPQDDPDLTTALVKGVSDGCLDAGAALLGGETAIMPDLYSPGDFDMAGFCVGVVERDQILDGSRIQAGDQLLGITSSGLHSNGFSLVRKAVFDVGGREIDEQIPELGTTVAAALLTPTRIYARAVTALLKADGLAAEITGLVHVTGGGQAENTGRIIPDGLQAAIRRTACEVPPVFRWIQDLGRIDRDEMWQVFNMGIGMIVVLRPQAVDRAQTFLEQQGLTTHRLGEIRSGTEKAVYLD